MLFSSWLRNSKRSPSAARRRAPTSSRQRAGFCPRLESLEDRCLLAADIVQTNLVSDPGAEVRPGVPLQPSALITDSNLVNPWGLAASPGGAWWVSNEVTRTSTLYDTSGSSGSPVVKDSLVVTIPASSTAPLGPTGIVYNPTVSSGGFGGSPFLFDTADGTVSAWSSGTSAVTKATPGGILLGLAIATDHHDGTLLYASDFLDNKIDVYDQNFQPVTLPSGHHGEAPFTDPKLPAGYSAFNIQAIDNRLYVEYAPAADVLGGTPGAGQGAVDVYNSDGRLEQRLIRPGNDHLDQPWAVAMAPSNFGPYSNDLLVGNFGDGTINAFDAKNGHFKGEMEDTSGQPIAIPHLWGLAFGNGGAAGPTNTLYFTAGLTSHLANLGGPPAYHGLFGSLQVATHQDGDYDNDDGDNHGHHDDAPIMSAPSMSSPTIPPSNGMNAQQVDAIFQEFGDASTKRR